jgi:hypothetical protein
MSIGEGFCAGFNQTFFHRTINPFMMLKNYLVTAFRNFKRNKIFSLINILGMSVGVSSSLVIFFIVQYHYSFDHFEKDGDRIFRIVSNYEFQSNPGYTRGVQAPLADAVKKEVAGIDLTAGFRYYTPYKLTIPEEKSSKPATFRSQENIIFANESYFQLLPYHWLAGSAKSSLSEPGRVVLSESRARLYFPALAYSDIIGKRIIYNDTVTAQVSGIVQDLDIQGHSDFTFKEFISLATVLDNPGLRKNFGWDEWGSTTSDQQLYVRLSKGSSATQVEMQLKSLVRKYRGDDMAKNHYMWAFMLQPLSDIHFNTKYGILKGELADRNMLYGLMLIAAFLLFLGCINFINLSTAQASNRSKEIGIRKTMGSSRKQLVYQFMSETFVVTLLATIVSLGLTPVLLHIFRKFVPEGLHFSLAQPALYLFLAGLVLFVTFLAGFYPALYLSKWNASAALKNQAFARNSRTRKAWIRQGLTVSQFIIAQFFVMGTLMVGKQIRFMLDRDLGFNKEAILSFGTPYHDTSELRRQFLITELKKIPGIAMASLANDVPSSNNWWTTSVKYQEGKKDIEIGVEIKSGDTSYLNMFHIPLLAGRNLLPADTVKELIINETCLHALGFLHPQEAIGKTLLWEEKKVPIVGVMRDFNAHPLNFKIGPTVFCEWGENSRRVVVALQSGGNGESLQVQKSAWEHTIAAMEKTFKQVYPEEEFQFAFLDEDLVRAYTAQENISNLLKWASGLTILISCLGLLGLVIYTTNSRTKEIGVRKVLGASVPNIVSLLSRDFLVLVGIAFFIAIPMVWWATSAWLQNFEFRTTISWLVFLEGGIGMMAIALATLSVQTIRAARANPVISLKSE